MIVPSVTYRIGGTFSTTLRWQRSDIDLPEGAFVTNLGTFRATYNFNTLVNVQGLVQYNDRTDRWSTNIRFNWQQTAATGSTSSTTTRKPSTASAPSTARSS